MPARSERVSAYGFLRRKPLLSGLVRCGIFEWSTEQGAVMARTAHATRWRGRAKSVSLRGGYDRTLRQNRVMQFRDDAGGGHNHGRSVRTSIEEPVRKSG